MFWQNCHRIKDFVQSNIKSLKFSGAAVAVAAAAAWWASLDEPERGESWGVDDEDPERLQIE